MIRWMCTFNIETLKHIGDFKATKTTPQTQSPRSWRLSRPCCLSQTEGVGSRPIWPSTINCSWGTGSWFIGVLLFKWGNSWYFLIHIPSWKVAIFSRCGRFGLSPWLTHIWVPPQKATESKDSLLILKWWLSEASHFLVSERFTIWACFQQ